jgi:hypothetical protein
LVTALIWVLTQLSPSVRDLWDTSVLSGAFLVVLLTTAATTWVIRYRRATSTLLLGSTVVVSGLLRLQRPLLQFQQSQAQLKLQLHYLLRQLGKLVSHRLGHDLRTYKLPSSNFGMGRIVCIDFDRQTVDACRHAGIATRGRCFASAVDRGALAPDRPARARAMARASAKPATSTSSSYRARVGKPEFG